MPSGMTTGHSNPLAFRQVRNCTAAWPSSAAGGGLLQRIDDEGDDIVLTVFDMNGRQAMTEALTVQRATKVRVQGGE